jgi:queuosine precursor transporter
MSLNHNQPKRHENKLLILTGIYVFCILLAEIFGIKTIPLGIENITLWPIFIKELKVSVAIFLLPLIFSINDVVIEIWGKKTAKTMYRIGLACIVWLALFSFFATHLPTSALFAPNETAYDQIFSMTMRIAIASIIAFGISDLLDIAIFSRIRERIKNLALKSNISNICAQFIDTTLFVYLAFYMPWAEIFWSGNHAFMWWIILPYWIFKCCMSVITTPFVYLGVKWAKK